MKVDAGLFLNKEIVGFEYFEDIMGGNFAFKFSDGTCVLIEAEDRHSIFSGADFETVKLKQRFDDD